jgi:hypothetical protein
MNQREVATLAGGCFWCLEAVFLELRGVLGVKSGYAGGHVANPTYEQVCGKQTGHAEVVQVTFDPSEISYEDLLHDPRSDHEGSPGQRHRAAVPLGNLHALRCAARGGVRAVEGGAVALGCGDRHGDRGAGEVLAGGGVPRQLFRAESGESVLRGRGGAEGGEGEKDLL